MSNLFKPETQTEKSGHTFTGRPAHALPLPYIDAHPAFALQRLVGNQAVQRLLNAEPRSHEAEDSFTTRRQENHSRPLRSGYIAPEIIQTKLAIGQAGDMYEREADAMADRLMSLSAEGPSVQRKCGCASGSGAAQTCDDCAQEQPLSVQRSAEGHADSASAGDAPPIVHEVLSSPGQPLADGARAQMEAGFDYDFSAVRVHTGARAAESAQALGARAYTVGREIVFGGGEYAPETSSGRHLLAHELTHVVQQRGAASAIQRIPESFRPRHGGRRHGDPSRIPSMSCRAMTLPFTCSSGHPCFPVMFDHASYVVTPFWEHQIALWIASMRTAWPRHFTPYFTIHGYASVEGTDEFNWLLSCMRTGAVGGLLVRTYHAGYSTYAYGETDYFDAGAHEPNRRAIIELDNPPPPPPPPPAPPRNFGSNYGAYMHCLGEVWCNMSPHPGLDSPDDRETLRRMQRRCVARVNYDGTPSLDDFRSIDCGDYTHPR